jgi:hypothetical protein
MSPASPKLLRIARWFIAYLQLFAIGSGVAHAPMAHHDGSLMAC